MRKPPRFIAVEGPIGVGKSTLVAKLGERLGARIVRDNGRDNPFLDAFYADPARHAMATQLHFLLQRYQQKDELNQGDLFSPGGVISDFLFARDRMMAQLNLHRHELAIYDKIYTLLNPQVTRPDLVVYLQARPEVLMSRIKKQSDRPSRAPSREYVERVAAAYAEFFFGYQESPLLVVNTSEIDFVASPADLDALIAVIQKTKAGITHISPLGST